MKGLTKRAFQSALKNKVKRAAIVKLIGEENVFEWILRPEENLPHLRTILSSKAEGEQKCRSVGYLLWWAKTPQGEQFWQDGVERYNEQEDDYFYLDALSQEHMAIFLQVAGIIIGNLEGVKEEEWL